MRPPPRMGTSSFVPQLPRRPNSHNPRTNHSFEDVFANPTYNDNKHVSPFPPRSGYFSKNAGGNDNGNGFGATAHKRPSFAQKEQEEETEPEWFSVPVTRQDFVDLHGFNDEEEEAAKTKPSSNGAPSMPNSSMPQVDPPVDISYNGHRQNENPLPRRSSPTQNNFHPRRQQNSVSFDQHVNNISRFRNPLHQPKSRKFVHRHNLKRTH
jgi:hypothetical protein